MPTPPNQSPFRKPTNVQPDLSGGAAVVPRSALPRFVISTETAGASDDCGVAILGAEPNKYWHDHKGAQINAIRTRTLISEADVVIVRFGEKYKQWNAAFDAGYAAALGKSLVVMHGADHQHALKEVDAAALAVVEQPSQVAQIIAYVLKGQLP